MKNMLLHKIKDTERNVMDYGYAKFQHRSEIRKFQDSRRKEIYEKVQLTDSQKNQIKELFEKNYGRGIPDTWHRHYTAFTGQFDVNYFPELLYIPEFEHFMNYQTEYAHVFENKNVLPLIAKAVGVRMPEQLYQCVSGYGTNPGNEHEPIEAAAERLHDAGDLFFKPSVGTSSGVGCRLVHAADGVDTLTGEVLAGIFRGMGRDFVVQRRVRCHESLRRIYPEAVNTFRIMTYFWKGEVLHAPVIMRIGQGGRHLDNAHAGGMFIALDEDGSLHTTAFTEFKEKYEEHPDTHIRFDECKVALLPRVIETAERMHRSIPQLGVVNWDFTLDEDGTPLLIEANVLGGGIWVFEMAHGKGAFGSLTPEILRWLRQMKRMSYTEREAWFARNVKE